ncbi:MAG: rhamnulokinase [Candidatus Sumerlaeota bacterium]|nr:rhamnulokinase [Candidatus Sumerlaeota bacterium]
MAYGVTKYSCLAVDLGASSGRVMSCVYENGVFDLREVHRFPNGGIMRNDTLYWDFTALWNNVKEGLRKGIAEQKAAGHPTQSLGIDTWGNDFGLIGPAGKLLDDPVHYRDKRTDGMMETVFREDVPPEIIFRETGVQFMQLNTIYQIASLKRAKPDLLAQAAQFLLMPDLFHFLLTGQIGSEYTIASTTQLSNPHTHSWSDLLISKLGLPRSIFPQINPPGSLRGRMLPAVTSAIGGGAVEVIAVATHDTASAVAAVPADTDDFAYLSCGTWSLLGVEVRKPVITDETMRQNLTNEGGVDGCFRLLKNIAGLWLLQESKAEWERQNKPHTWAQMTAMAAAAPPFHCFIDPDDACFVLPGDMPGRIREFCRETGQPVPETDGAVVRCVLESLALKYRHVMNVLHQVTGMKMPILHMVGGGIQNTLLCQWSADACERVVVAGPIEATALGNVAIQLVAAGIETSIPKIRAAIRESAGLRIFKPSRKQAWQKAAQRFETILSNGTRNSCRVNSSS